MSEITLASPPTTVEVAAAILASMAALSGVVTDYNVGSQIRTQTESLGAVVEQQGVWSQALAFQAIVYSALALFSIVPGVATPASGAVVFSTSQAVSGGPPIPLNVNIPQGFIFATSGGIQAQTTAAALLPAGSSGVTVLAQALVSGTTGNIAASGFSQLVNGLAAPLYVSNPLPFTGGTNPTTPSQSLATFAATIASIGLSSPAAIANAAIGVSTSAGETVAYSTCYEPWAAAGSGVGSGTAGWTLYIDNGAGTASSGLIAAVVAKLNGGFASGATNSGPIVGYRDAGVPYSVLALTPTLAAVSVSGTVSNPTQLAAVSGAIAAAVSGYFSLPFGAPAEQAQISAVSANATQGALTALSVTLSAVSGSSVSLLTPSVSGRVVLSQLLINLSS